VVHLLVEGMGIRAISRFIELDQKTVLRILETTGEHCAQLLDAKVRNLKAEYVAADELQCFVKTKEQNTAEGDMEHGMFFTFLSIDMFSKLIINWRTDKRTLDAAKEFMNDLRSRIPNRFQLATDAATFYRSPNGAVANAFGNNIDYATEQKVFKDAFLLRRPFTSPSLTRIKKRCYIGSPEMSLITTCHLERMNLSVRIFMRRFTRLTLGFSKKLENLRHAVALFVAHFNFCRVHSAHGKTPANDAGLTDKTWTIEDLLSATT
jgi:hypothetical protein